MAAGVNPVGGSGKKEARDSACTPKWLAALIGSVHLDPCWNPRSHIGGMFRCSLEHGGDGLARADEEPRLYRGSFRWGMDAIGRNTTIAGDDWEVFINPPYAAGQVIRWVRHYRHTRFIFLLRWDPSTRWFAELMPHCTHVWFPRKRINFEPPPGVTFSSNPFPHALYLRDPSPELLERLAPRGRILIPGVEHRDGKSRHGQRVVQADAPGGGEDRDPPGGAPRNGGTLSGLVGPEPKRSSETCYSCGGWGEISCPDC